MLQWIGFTTWMLVSVLYSVAICQMFEFPITVSDGVDSKQMAIGVHPDGSEDFDPGLDLLAPPPPPSGTFDARLRINFQDFLTDIRENTMAEKGFCLLYQTAPGRTITLSWDPAFAASLGSFVITDKFGGDQFTLDMTTTGMLEVGNDPAIIDGVRIGLTPDIPVGIPTDVMHSAEKPDRWRLKQNYPNPFNGFTGISYSVPHSSWIEVSIFTTGGQKVKTLVTGNHQKGLYHLLWDGTGEKGEVLTSGVYVYRLFSPAFSDAKRMVFIK